ncbi:MAG: hypothetical protein WBE94_17845, partial [Pseudolabrys sp.]
VGWLSLVGGGPFPVVPKVPLYQYTDVIILLTGGLNTQNRWTSTQDDIDTRQRQPAPISSWSTSSCTRSR